MDGWFEADPQTHFYRFVAPSSGRYQFKSQNSSGDPWAMLFSSSRNAIASNDNGAGGKDFLLTATLVAGESYYLETGNHTPITEYTHTYKVVRVLPPQ
jgi:hypothetical protein